MAASRTDAFLLEYAVYNIVCILIIIIIRAIVSIWTNHVLPTTAAGRQRVRPGRRGSIWASCAYNTMALTDKLRTHDKAPPVYRVFDFFFLSSSSLPLPSLKSLSRAMRPDMFEVVR